ncbi:type II toxin-antitoxin system RelE family toxin [Marinoscillum pacificum]|uniref:type II toxin-antitoxin system RelE family toxin n=1 Tax=Marinoscillum pacificum TaxID=392723 RepID=UPI002157AC9E|nr:type II toxin-antitoxin system RelE/ParE family toxin [Marinoscillum pacificum]
MSFEILTIPPFDKQLKKLAKKYPSIKQDFTSLLKSLQEDPQQGTLLCKGCYKVRMAISSKGKGKSGGSRVITHLVIDDQTIYLLSIYDKSEKASISDAELKELLGWIED